MNNKALISSLNSFTMVISLAMTGAAVVYASEANNNQDISLPSPNIVFIYADDMGWTGSSVAMVEGDASTRSDFYQTPNLEKLAANGMVFSNAYSPAAMCTPSRVGILTGLTPAQLHITTPGRGRVDDTRKVLTPRPATRLPRDIETIGTLLKAEGYATALLGKWHIGRDDHAGLYGFDVHDGSTGNDNRGTSTDPKEIFSMTRRGIEFIENSVKADKPFYLQLSHYAVHSPTQTRPDSSNKFKALSTGKYHNDHEYAGMTWDLDLSLGPLFQALSDLEIDNNTYIVYSSDHGAPGNRRNPNNAPLSGGKGTLFEGGIRVPLIISGPAVKTGYSSQNVTGMDLFATFASWAGAEITSTESVDLTPLLTSNEGEFQREQGLLFHYPHYGRGSQTPQTALISGHWKLLKDWDADSYQLFDIKEDIGESRDLSRKEPERLQQMIAEMDQRLATTGAQLPRTNPEYNSGAESRRRGKRR